MDIQSERATRPTGEQLLIRVEDAARLCDLSRARMYQLIAEGEIPSVTIGRSRRVSIEALRRWVDGLTEGIQR